MEQDDDFGIRIAHPSKRKLSIVASRHNIIDHVIPNLDQTTGNIMEVPEFLSTQQRMSKHNRTKNSDIDGSRQNNVGKNYTCDMIIELLNEYTIQNCYDPDFDMSENIEPGNIGLGTLSLQSVILHYKLDFKQSVAFEIMACSFILDSLNKENIPESALIELFASDSNKFIKYKGDLTSLKQNMKKRRRGTFSYVFIWDGWNWKKVKSSRYLFILPGM